MGLPEHYGMFKPDVNKIPESNPNRKHYENTPPARNDDIGGFVPFYSNCPTTWEEDIKQCMQMLRGMVGPKPRESDLMMLLMEYEGNPHDAACAYKRSVGLGRIPYEGPQPKPLPEDFDIVQWANNPMHYPPSTNPGPRQQ